MQLLLLIINICCEIGSNGIYVATRLNANRQLSLVNMNILQEISMKTWHSEICNSFDGSSGPAIGQRRNSLLEFKFRRILYQL